MNYRLSQRKRATINIKLKLGINGKEMGYKNKKYLFTINLRV
jgi:hypothetical protein